MSSPVYAGLSIGSDNIALTVRSESEDKAVLYHMPLIALRLNGADHGMFMNRFKATYAKIGNSSYILGKDAFNLTDVFPKAEPVRPIINGVINSAESDSIELLTAFIKKLISTAKVKVTDVAFTFPAPSISGADTTYHRQVVEHILESLSIKHQAVYDVHASAYTLLGDEEMTGITVESGYNLTSICFSYLNIPAITFSIPIGTKFLEDAVSRDLQINMRDARRLIDSYTKDSDKLHVYEALAVKAGFDRFVKEVSDKLKAGLDMRKSNLISYDGPVALAVAGGAFEYPNIRESLAAGIYQAIQSTSMNKIKTTKVAPNPRWSAASGAFILITSDMDDVEAEQPVSSEILTPISFDQNPAEPIDVPVIAPVTQLPQPSVEEEIHVENEQSELAASSAAKPDESSGEVVTRLDSKKAKANS